MKLILLLCLFSNSLWASFVHLTLGKDSNQILLTQEGQSWVLNSANDKLVLYPDITPDGKELIYVTGPDHKDLHLKYKNLKTNREATFHFSHKSMIVHPQFTHNGKLVFFSAQDKDGISRIYFFNLKEEMKKQGKGLSSYSLDGAINLSEGETAFFPRPSSDGNFLVYQRNIGKKKELVFLDRVFNIKEVIAEGMSPALSFDERLVAYAKEIEGQYEIFIYDRTLKTHKQMTFDKNHQMAPAFTPDNTLVFSSQENGLFKIYELKNDKWNLLIGSPDKSHYAPQFMGETHFKQSLRASIIGAPRSSFGTVNYQDKIYMAGGHAGAEHTYPPESFQDTFVVYDIKTNTWKELPPRPVKAHGYQILAHEGYIYAFGGFAYSADHKPKWKSLSQIDRYSIKEDKWETVAHLNEPRSSNVAILIDDKAYIIGGRNSTPKFENDIDGKFHSSIEIFDFKNLKATYAPYELDLKRRAFTGLNYQDNILLIGGIGEGGSHFELQNRVTMIDPLTGKHTELTKLPFATFAPAAEIIDNELFVFGGMFQTGPAHYEYVSHIYAMDLDSKKWRHTGRFLQETKGFSQVTRIDENTLGILGGHRYFEGFDSPVTTFETFSK